MICKHVELTMDTTQPRDVAKAMLRFWQFQCEQSRQELASDESKLEHMGLANERAVEEWRKNDELGFGGPSVPYSTLEIERVRSRIPQLKKHHREARALYGYMLNFITDKAHPESEETNEHSID